MRKTGFLVYAGMAVFVAFVVAAFATLVQDYAQSTVRPKSDDGQASKPISSADKQRSLKSVAMMTRANKLSADEAHYRQHLTQRLKPLLEFRLSEADQTSLKAALEALQKRDVVSARRHREQISLAAGRKFVTWSILRSGYGRPDDYRGFLRQNPLWPDQRLLRRRLEQSLFIDGGSARGILAQFKDTPPQTDDGYAAMASAHLALGNSKEAKRYAAKAWCGGGMTAGREKQFLGRFGKLLTNADHTCRLNRLLVANLRWNSSRKARAHAVRRVIQLLDKNDQKKATARLSAFLRQKIATKWMNEVPASQRKGDLGYAFQRIQHLRLQKKHSSAWKLLATIPAASDQLINSDAWWEERHDNALNAIKAGRHKQAASFVENIRPEGTRAAQDQAFFAGWLALRKRNRPKDAIAHFQRLLKLVNGPLSTSKAHYWLGRSYAALGQKAKAKQQYEAGARYRDTFHGLLAAQAAAPGEQSLELPLPALPDDGDVKDFLNADAVQAAMIARRIGLPRSRIVGFFRTLVRRLNNEAKVAMLGQLAAAFGDGQLEVRVGKAGVARGFNMYIFSYPLGYLPDYEPLRTPPEQAVVFAIARQESEFNTYAVSGAGARGMLQIMPATARGICRQYKIKCNLKNLRDKPSYNTRLASAYIADRTAEFNGSYILTFTGYNAGPGRTRQWLRQLGDPRSPKLQPLDWIYRIPFEETRLYTQKVLSNIQVYRARLGIKNPLRLVSDMNRSRR